VNQDTPKPSKYTPFTFISAAGTPVIITDDWVEDFTFDTSVADVIDKVTDEVYKFVLVVRDEEGVPVMHWLRRVNESCYVDTGLYAPMDYVPDAIDELCEAHAETVDNAEMELVMAIGMFPRYDIKAEWMDQSRRDYLNKLQAGADDASSEAVEEKRQSFFGISMLI
jgi:hypothetical protein